MQGREIQEREKVTVASDYRATLLIIAVLMYAGII